jgi:hypothetical protein
MAEERATSASKAFKYSTLDTILEEEGEYLAFDPIPEGEGEHHNLDPIPEGEGEHRNLDPIPEEEGEEFCEDYSSQELEDLRQTMGTPCKERRMSTSGGELELHKIL